MKINLDTRMFLDVMFIAYIRYGEKVLSDAELLLPLRAAYETTTDTQKKMSIAVLTSNYCLGLEFMHNFSYDYPAWRVDSTIKSYVGSMLEEE